MPQASISSECADIVVPPHQIAAELTQLARQYESATSRVLAQGTSARTLEQDSFSRILAQMRTVSGVDFRLYKPTTIRRRIARRMLMHRIDSLANYLLFLQGNTKELRELHEDALINVTSFFRDTEVFDALKSLVFPGMLGDKGPEPHVRIWVAGCSTGEEVYSIAICLLEYLTGSPFEPIIQVFGTDASEQNVQKARMGLYPETIVNEISPERLRRFFVKTDKGYQVAKRVRDLCIFARQNLCHDPPFSRLDLISCRNVLIYFGIELRRQIIPTFHYALRSEGYLLLGMSETIREFTDLFVLRDRRYKIYSRTGAGLSRPILDVAPRITLPEPVEARSHRDNESWGDLELRRAADRVILARYAPPGVVVNERLEIVLSLGHTGSFLEIPQGRATLDLTRMAKEHLAHHITTAVRRAVAEDIPVQVRGLQISEEGKPRDVVLEVLPIHATSTARNRYFLVLFVPAPREEGEPIVLEAEHTPRTPDENERQLTQLTHDLASTRLYLQSLLEERDAKNQELVSANEEIQSANEELQSTNEELETTKEELQSSNEELQTVNDELQNRNAVLTQASNDLSNLLNSVNLPVLMLSNDFSIRHFTPPTQRLMNLRSSDVGRPFGEIRSNLQIDNLEPLFTEVLDSLTGRELEVQDREGHWHLLRIRPYRTSENRIEGLVVVLVDIDQLRRSQMELRDARDFARYYIVNLNETGDLLTRLVNESVGGGSRDQEDSVMEPALTDLTCPDCGGTLWELSSGRRKEYRCREGHVFSPTSMLAEQFNKQEAALYSAIVKLQEGVSLTQRLLDSVEPAIQEKLRQQKKELQAQLDQLRLILMRRQGLGV